MVATLLGDMGSFVIVSLQPAGRKIFLPRPGRDRSFFTAMFSLHELRCHAVFIHVPLYITFSIGHVGGGYLVRLNRFIDGVIVT